MLQQYLVGICKELPQDVMALNPWLWDYLSTLVLWWLLRLFPARVYNTCALNQQLTVFSFAGLKSQMMRSNGRFRTGAASIAGGSAATQKVIPRHAAAAVASWGRRRAELAGKMMRLMTHSLLVSMW